jgi:hypothetical protein
MTLAIYAVGAALLAVWLDVRRPAILPVFVYGFFALCRLPRLLAEPRTLR